MMDRRTSNINIFKDTIALIESNEKLSTAVKDSVDNQILYFEEDEVELCETLGKNCKTTVSAKRSFEAAAPYAKAGKKVCVLNFASAVNPGGGVVNGSSAQEESLCRCSTLYPCLNIERFWNNFYTPHRAAFNALYNDDCIYTPGVYVCKSDESFPERIDEKEWYQVDVLTSAAPNLRFNPSNIMNPSPGTSAANISEEELMKLHLKRIERIFRVAAANGAEVLILGAYGCGAFFNPPKLVASAFKQIQEKYETYFDVIEYAVFCGGHERKNYDVFRETFGGEVVYDLSRFHKAHQNDYERALREVKDGNKRTHWMWYIFPQIAGLGMSRTSQFYSIANLGEAKAYLADEVLGAHLIELCEVLLSLEINSATRIFHTPDDMKLKSCMTLFEKAAPEQEIFSKVLDKFFGGKRDVRTLDILSR